MTTSMFLSSGNFKANADGTQNQNLAKNKTIQASSYEVEKTSPSKAVDGDVNTRWGTAQNKAANEWIEVDLGKSTSMKQINLLFERSDEEQNILAYNVEVYNGSTYEQVYAKETKAKQKEIIVLPESVQGSKVKVTILQADGGPLNWVNVGIAEIEVYEKEVVEAEDRVNVNHISNAVMSASSVEDNLVRLQADKANDGDKTTRWASDYETPSSQWLKATFQKPTKIQQFNVYFLNRDVAPNDSNVKTFSIRYTDINGVEHYVLKDYANELLGSDKGYKTNVKITLDEPIVATDVQLCEFNANATSYNNISVAEFEAYSNEIEEDMSLDDVVDSIQGRDVANTMQTLPMPSVPEGFQVKINGADFEQIVANDGAIVHPLTDKTVRISFEVTEIKTGKSKLTVDKDYVIKGVYEPKVNTNTKPVVIPEIAEWYAMDTTQLSITSLQTITYQDPSLEAIVDEFIADYKALTSITLNKQVSETNVANAFNFVLEAPDALLGDEGYTMKLMSDQIVVTSQAVTGNMYAMQTILQMYKQHSDTFPVGTMRDYPRFETRGFLLDVARKPISMQMLNDITRTMRYYKMNDFQVHLSDNYIFLEQYGCKDKEMEAFQAYDAFRLESGLHNDAGQTPTASDYAYSKAEFKDFITNERAFGMNIVPEIDVPAHASSFTKIWPEIMVKGKVSSTSSLRPLIDHIDVSKPEAVDKVKEIFDDYTKGDNPTFDADTTVHIGADEFLDNYTAYRNFINTIVPYVKHSNPVRMWGGLTWIDDGKTQITKEAIEQVQVNLWSSDWADGLQMYDMGYKLINTIDDYTYMVPNGNLGRANAYGDLLNIDRIFTSFEPNRLKTRSGYKMVPSGDDQVMGAAFAMWHDNIDKSASGLSESDLFWRFFDAMPFFAEKTWAATGKEKGDATTLQALANHVGIAPNTNPYDQEDHVGDTYEHYDFNEGYGDVSENDRDITDVQADIIDETLVLNKKESYVETPLKRLGNGNMLSFDIQLTAPAKPGQILFESDAAYGSHDIRIMPDGTLGFTRELYAYSFSYELPVGKMVHIDITTNQQKTQLYVNDVLVGNAVGKFIHNDIEKKTNITNATFALPLQRIGSKTNAIQARIDNVEVSEHKAAGDVYNKAAWTGKTNTETVYDSNEGLLTYAFDNKTNTIWHSNWQGATDKLTGNNSFYAEIDFAQVYEINQFSFTPRSPQVSGIVTKADLFIKENANDEWKLVAENATFASDSTKKTFFFDKQKVQYAKFVAKASNDGWVAVSEFDINNTPTPTCTLYVQSDGHGSVTGGTDVRHGTEVTITATPDKGYVFDGWYKETNEKVSDQASYTFHIEQNMALTARFKKLMYIVSIDGVEQQVAYGENVDVVDLVKPGHKFLGYFEEGATTPYDFSKPIEGNLVVSSRFEAYKILLDDVKYGQVKQTEMDADGKITLTATPDTGYTFVGWFMDGTLLSGEIEYTIDMIQDMNITTLFKPNQTSDIDFWKEILSKTIKKAQDIMDLGGLQGVHEIVVKNVTSCLQNAVLVYANHEATADEIKDAWLALANAMHYLDFKADKTDLGNLLNACADLDLSKYKNDEHMETYITALRMAKTVYDNEFALEDSIQRVHHALLDAKASLQLKEEIDVTALQYMLYVSDLALKEVAKYDTTADSWNIFITTLEEAKKVMIDKTSQQEVDETTLKLASAYENIRFIANENTLGELQAYINILDEINPKEYTTQTMAFFHETRAIIQSYIEKASYTMKEYQAVLTMMNEVEKRIETDKVSLEDVKQPNNKPVINEQTIKDETIMKGVTKPKTGDATSTGVMAGSIVLAGFTILSLQRKRRKK